jgi:solute carrier family 25 carnitine/acylcarnitine transporter 20/29
MNMFAGSMGGLSYWTIAYPFDVVKSAMQSDNPDPSQRKYKGVADAFSQLYREGGLFRFTRGYSACILRALPANAILLTTATKIKEVGYSWLEK